MRIHPASAATALMRAGAAVLWLVAITVPWTSHGLLSHSSLLDAAGLIRDGAVPSVPTSAAWLTMIPALCGALVLALAWWPSWWVRVPRMVVGLVATITICLLLGRLSAWPDRLGPAAWLSLVGIVCGAIGEVVDVARVCIVRVGGRADIGERAHGPVR